MSFKGLFSRSLAPIPAGCTSPRTAIICGPTPASTARSQAWNDAARLADRKWDKVMDEVWPEAQAMSRASLAPTMPDAIVFASNTHDFLVRLVTAAPRQAGRSGCLTTDGEFHSARRQFARWEEEGEIGVDRVAAEPFDLRRAVPSGRAEGELDLILVSQVLFGRAGSWTASRSLPTSADPRDRGW